MEHISKHAKAATTSLKEVPATRTIKKKPALPISYISKLFRIFKMEYGTAFTSNFKSDEELNEAKVRWSQRLAHLSDEQIKFGVDNMTKVHRTFAPNINEFIAICLSCRNNDQLFNFVRLPPSLIVSKEVVCNGIKELKKTCGLK